MGRIGDAVRTLLQPSWDAQIAHARAENRALQAEARALITEVNDTLEKLSAWSAREAKRRSRAAQTAIEFDPEEVKAREAIAAAHAAQQVAPVGSPAWKAQMLAGLNQRRRELRNVAPPEEVLEVSND